MSETPSVPGAPNAEEFMAMQKDPNLKIKGVLIVDGSDLPSDAELGRMVRTKITTPGEYVQTEYFSRRIVVIDGERPELLPEELKPDNLESEETREWISELSYDFIINLLKGGEEGELGELVREALVEEEECYSREEGEVVPGYHDPANGGDSRPGEQRSYVVIGGS